MKMELTDSPPPRRVRALIGDVIMLGADLEMVLALAICKMDGVDPRRELGRLSRMHFNKKLEALRARFAATPDHPFTDAFGHFERVNAPFVHLRNTLAHGRYMGRFTSKGVSYYAFLNPGEKATIEERAVNPDAQPMIFQNTNERLMRNAIQNGLVAIDNLKSMFEVQYLHEMFKSKFGDVQIPD